MIVLPRCAAPTLDSECHTQYFIPYAMLLLLCKTETDWLIRRIFRGGGQGALAPPSVPSDRQELLIDKLVLYSFYIMLQAWSVHDANPNFLS